MTIILLILLALFVSVLLVIHWEHDRERHPFPMPHLEKKDVHRIPAEFTD